ncbi:MAG: phosphopentomutase [Lachnospiraceae bacterium]
MGDIKRVFLIVLDSFGIGDARDAAQFHDEGSNTLKTIINSPFYHASNMERLGLSTIDGVKSWYRPEYHGEITGAFARMEEASMGKDTTIGHWEIAGIIKNEPLPTFPDGFPDEIIASFSEKTGRKVLCNKPFSGTEVLLQYGKEHMETGALIVYTSADSVFQIAAHEEIVPVEQLYEYCRIARELLQGKYGVGRVIARPFTGIHPEFTRTPKRHDFSLEPTGTTMLDVLVQNGYDTLGVGKIYDIFAGRAVQKTVSIVDNADGMRQVIVDMQKDFHGLCFVNLVDFDMKYGHRNDIDGYAKAIAEFDAWLGMALEQLRPEDVLMITADHGCDPGTPSTDHSRENTPFLVYGDLIKKGVSLGTRKTFADIAATVLDMLDCPNHGEIKGESMYPRMRKEGM